jgi:hypothetical protein
MIATFQGHGPDNQSPGGIAVFDDAGHVVRSQSAADPSADQTTLRPYRLAVVAPLDRIVVALTYMGIPTGTRSAGPSSTSTTATRCRCAASRTCP